MQASKPQQCITTRPLAGDREGIFRGKRLKGRQERKGQDRWEEKEEKEEHSRLDADIMVEHCGSSVLAIQVEVGVLSHVDRGGGTAAGFHTDP